MSEPQHLCLLSDLGLLRLRGSDARTFLQGQVSNDLALLQPDRLLRAGVHNPQGRTLALLGLIATATDEISALLPRELATSTAQLLRRYVLRARVNITDDSEQVRVLGVLSAPADACSETNVSYAPGRHIQLQSADQSAPQTSLTRQQWRALDIAAGLPQVYAATAGQFVAQMLNLDCIDAISFTKGCYTGQEVIARAHYRGRVKRRMQHFASRAAAQLSPGDSGQLADGRAFKVVESVQRSDGRCEFLAVTALSTEPAEVEAAAAADPRLEVEPLTLPYALPA